MIRALLAAHDWFAVYPEMSKWSMTSIALADDDGKQTYGCELRVLIHGLRTTSTRILIDGIDGECDNLISDRHRRRSLAATARYCARERRPAFL